MSLAWQAGVRVASFTYAIKSLMGKVSGKENEALHHLYTYMQNKVDFASDEFIPDIDPGPYVKVYVSFTRRKELAPLGPFELKKKEFESFKHSANPAALKLLKFEVRKIDRTQYM